MKHRAITEKDGRLYMATHNHDSIGECLGRLATGRSRRDALDVIEDEPEPGHYRTRAIRKALLDGGITK